MRRLMPKLPPVAPKEKVEAISGDSPHITHHIIPEINIGMHLQGGLTGIRPYLDSPRAFGLFDIGAIDATHRRRVNQGLHPVKSFQDKRLFLGFGLLGGRVGDAEEENDEYCIFFHILTSTGSATVGLPVFFFIFVFHHGEVGLIAAWGDVVVFEGLEDRTAGFVGVGTVGETAVFREAEDLGEVAGEFLGGHVEGAEAFDAGGIYCPPPTQRDHFTEGGGVLTEVVGGGDFGGAEVGIRNEAVDEGGFPHATVTTEQRDLPT